MPPPPPPRLEPPANGAELYIFPEKLMCFVMNYLCILIVEADKVTRSLGEEAVKEMITDGIMAIRRALDEVARVLPEDENERSEYAQRFMEATREPGELSENGFLVFDTAEAAGGVNGTDGIEGVMSPHQMQRVGDDFGASEVPYTQQDIADALGWVRAMICDVQHVLLKLDDRDVEELAQMTLISLKILVGYAKSTHRTLTHLCGMAYQAAPVEGTDGPGDNGAGPSVPAARNLQNTFLEVDDYDQSPEDKGMLPWEPLAPKLLLVAQRLAAEGKDRPLTATVILTAVLPFSGIAAFLVAPVLASDAVLQWGANTPVGKTVGHGTKNAFELSKLGWVASKLMTKQALRFASQELNRVGGVTGLTCRAGEGALWTVVHPIDATMMGVGIAATAGRFMIDKALWVGDLAATIYDEAFTGHVDAGT